MTDSTTQISGNSPEIAHLLQDHGITPTPQRVEIATRLLARPQHLSADQVLALTTGSGIRVSKATVYNTLGLFARKGLIRELNVDPVRTFYDSSTHPHHHFYNPVTQELHDLDEGQIDIRLPEDLPQGTEIDRVEVVIHIKPSY